MIVCLLYLVGQGSLAPFVCLAVAAQRSLLGSRTGYCHISGHSDSFSLYPSLLIHLRLFLLPCFQTDMTEYEDYSVLYRVVCFLVLRSVWHRMMNVVST